MTMSSSKASRKLIKIGEKVIKRFSNHQLKKRRKLSKNSALFDADFYQLQLQEIGQTTTDPWMHYCTQGFRMGLNPHPFFDNDFYRDRHLPGEQYKDIVPFEHYLQNPGINFETHPMSNMDQWISVMTQSRHEERAKSSLTWLEYFLEKDLFDLRSATRELAASYLAETCNSGKLSSPNSSRIETQATTPTVDLASPPAIFDTDYYLATYSDIADANMDPWQHYCDHGHRENRNPNPIFHTEFYKASYLPDQPNINPVVHYLSNDSLTLSTHPMFDAAIYFSQLDLTERQFRSLGIDLLSYFMRCNRKQLVSPSPFFFSQKYIQDNKDLENLGVCPLYHYLRHGKREGRLAPVDPALVKALRFRTTAELESLKLGKIANQQFVVDIANLPDQPTILLVSHESSMTGAPLIALKLAETIQAKIGVNIVSLILRPGQILDRFHDLGPTLCLDGATLKHRPHQFHSKIEMITELAAQANIVGTIVNSAESREVLSKLKNAGMPILSLIHENAFAYDPGQFDDIAKFSDRVVFPSEYTRQAALQRADFPKTVTETTPQGLLKEELLELSPTDPTALIRKQYDIPSDATFVLSCGTMDGRKGIDLFVATAIIALTKFEPGKLYFGWLGGPGYQSVLDQY